MSAIHEVYEFIYFYYLKILSNSFYISVPRASLSKDIFMSKSRKFNPPKKVDHSVKCKQTIIKYAYIEVFCTQDPLHKKFKKSETFIMFNKKSAFKVTSGLQVKPVFKSPYP